MKLEKVARGPFPTYASNCLGCGGSVLLPSTSKNDEAKPDVYADLDGPSFRAYYHDGCRPTLDKGQ